MKRIRSLLLGAISLGATAFVGTAQAQYAPYPYYYPPAPYAPAPAATPPAWSYNPYTSGLSPCPQRLPNDSTSCVEQMPPTFGQPSYRPWPR